MAQSKSSCGNNGVSCFLVILGVILLLAGLGSDNVSTSFFGWAALGLAALLHYNQRQAAARWKTEEELASVLARHEKNQPPPGGVPYPPQPGRDQVRLIQQVNPGWQDEQLPAPPAPAEEDSSEALVLEQAPAAGEPEQVFRAARAPAPPADLLTANASQPGPPAPQVAAMTAPVQRKLGHAAPPAAPGQPYATAPVFTPPPAGEPGVSSRFNSPAVEARPASPAPPAAVTPVLPAPPASSPIASVAPPLPSDPAPLEGGAGKFSYQPKLISSRFGATRAPEDSEPGPPGGQVQ